jgi:hypothetical protein
MGGLQRSGNLLDDPHRPRRLQGTRRQHVLQVAALNQPHMHIQLAVDFAVVMDRNYVRIVQLCGRLSFPAEPPHKGAVADKMPAV